MQLQECIKVEFFIELLFVLLVIVAMVIIYINALYLSNTISKFGKEHYYYFWKIGGGHGAQREWQEPFLWGRMLAPWKEFGFTDAEAEQIARTELFCITEVIVSFPVVILVYKEIFTYVGRTIRFCQ
ncbi:MAG: hypothetical protein ACLPSW_11365 [Roseiarcus sp.]